MPSLPSTGAGAISQLDTVSPSITDPASILPTDGDRTPTQERPHPHFQSTAESDTPPTSLFIPTKDRPHDETDEIIRQVEFYFSDDNLIGDAHLLSRTGPAGDGWVSLNEILGFRKMRVHVRGGRTAQVKKALALSTKLELSGHKFIRRKFPLARAPVVTPAVHASRDRNQQLVDKPWLSKNFLKPTGFESTATEGPIKPAEYEEDRKLYDPEETFTIRIERAVARYMAKRKFHQSTLQIFNSFLLFGGFSGRSNMFTGGFDAKQFEDFDTDQILDMKAGYAVSEQAVDGLDPLEGEASWIVDFAGMAEAFLSSEFLQRYDWTQEQTVLQTTGILQNFYRYLLHHDVCPEYAGDIEVAMDVCHLAEKELPILTLADAALPGHFNIACSILHKGMFATLRPVDPSADWVLPEDVQGMSDNEARLVFLAGIMAYGTDEQVESVAKQKEALNVVSDEDMGLEITAIEYAAPNAKLIYEDSRLKGTFVKPAGKLHCKSWKIPHRRPRDVPKHVLEAEEKPKHSKEYSFTVEEDALKVCQPGMKFQAIIKELENGIMWIDAIENLYPTFYKWTLNERIRGWKDPGPPTERMVRSNEKWQRGE